MCISHHVNSSKNHHADELEIHKETHKDHEMTLLAEILVTENLTLASDHQPDFEFSR